MKLKSLYSENDFLADENNLETFIYLARAKEGVNVRNSTTARPYAVRLGGTD